MSCSPRRSGSPRTNGEAGYSTLQRLWERPTLEVTGWAAAGRYTRDPARSARIHLVPPGRVPGPAARARGGPRPRGTSRYARWAGQPSSRTAERCPLPHRSAHPSTAPPPRKPCEAVYPDQEVLAGGSSLARCRPPPCSAGTRGEDAVLLVLHRRREAARPQRVPSPASHPRGHARLDALLNSWQTAPTGCGQ